MELKIENYLSESKMRDIAVEEFRTICREKFSSEGERILGNVGYAVARSLVIEALGDKADELIAEKAIEVINKLTDYSVFKKPDVWDHGSTPAYQTLQAAVLANKDLLNKKVRECISQLSKRDALEVMKSGIITIAPVKP